VPGYHRDAKNEQPRLRPNRQVLNEAWGETAWNAASFSVGDVSLRSQGARKAHSTELWRAFCLGENMNENLQPTQYRRTVVVDIETVALDPNLAKGALDALTGRIVCIGLLVDDGVQITWLAIAEEDEAQILTEFWATIHPTDVIVGHNVHEFDVPFIRQRSWILGVRPSRTIDVRKFYTVDIKDTMQIWTNWGFKKGVTLDALGAALSCGQKSGHGMDVAQWWATRDLDAIKQYCLGDVRVTYLVYCKLTYQQPRMRAPQQEREAPTISVAEQNTPVEPKRHRGRRPSFLPIRRPA
jgi:DNA polymerase elongation subunit (family B)